MVKSNVLILIILIVLLYVLHNQSKTKINIISPGPVKYIFMTGGFDSTYLLCKYVMNKIPTQGIYLKFDEVDGMSAHRNSAKYELLSINNAIKELHRMGYGKYILPTVVVPKFDISPDVKRKFNSLYKKGYGSRPINQYTYMAEYSLKVNKVIDCGCLCSNGTPLGRLLKNKLNCRKMVKPHSGLKVLRNLMFSLCGVKKYDMLKDAKKNNFAHILRNTHSCWRPVNGNPCGKCTMCRHRIV